MEIESPAEGTILDIKVPEGEGVPPGTVICYIGEGNEQVEEKKEKDLPPKQKKERKKISPVARKIAQSANLDIHTLVGTGPDGRITKADVLRALPDEKKNNKRTKASASKHDAENHCIANDGKPANKRTINNNDESGCDKADSITA